MKNNLKYNSQLITYICVISLCTLFSCSKTNNGIDNGQVIETPYSLYFSDSAGAIYNTNDGILIKKMPFTADGVPLNSLCISGNNLLFIKDSVNGNTGNANGFLYFSTDNGRNFNLSYDYIKHINIPGVNGFPVDLNQTQIVEVPRWHKIFCVSRDPSPNNYLGIVYSYWNGLWGFWTLEEYYSDSVNIVVKPTITSMTFLPNNYLFGFDGIQRRSLYRTDTFVWTKWIENFSVTPSTMLPTTGFFSIGHYNNEVIAIDNTGINGAWYSDDMGVNWYQFSGLPANRQLLCVFSPFEETCLVGTDSAGLFMLNANTHYFQASNHGLGSNLVIRGIVQKENFYKNGTFQKLVYLASNKGIYVSHDNGFNWTLVVKGNYTAIY